MPLIDASPAQDLLKAGLASWFLGNAALPGRNFRIDWEEFFVLGHRTKSSLLSAVGLEQHGFPLPDSAITKIAELRSSVLKRNLANIANAVKVASLLEAENIEVVAFKGVARAKQVYGSWDLRRAADIDLLVRHGDYRRAAAVLCNHGFKPGVSVESKWWHDYLGESPYLPESAGGAVVDLHHRLQQPGGPPPLDLGNFFDRKSSLVLGGRTLPVMGPEHASLVTCISYGKAVRNGEPWLVHAHELAMILRESSAAERESLRDLARRQGLERLWNDAVRNASALFAVDLGFGKPGASTNFAADELLSSALGEATRRKRPLRRTELQWRWTDGDLVTRIGRVASGLARVAASQLHHAREHREKLPPSPARTDANQADAAAPWRPAGASGAGYSAGHDT